MLPLNWVDATDLNSWANRRDAQARLPQVLRRLVHATIKHPRRVGFPAGESVQLGGWDGIVDVFEGNSFIPEGCSVWELGVNRDIKGKADSDYQKRCTDSLGANLAETTFVFVTPRRWGNKDAWAKDKNNEGIWAEVRAYDADDLEQWLELAPAVHAWLAQLLGKWPEGAIDLSSFWDEWKNSTSPPMNPELNLAGREKAVGSLKTWLNDDSSSLAVQADSHEESIAFFAATIYQMSEEYRVAHLARCVIAQDEQSWRQLVATSESLILIPTFNKPTGLGRAVSKGHHVLVPIGRESSPSSNALQLPRLEREGFERALVGMGISEERTCALAQQSRRSLLVLRRRLAATPEIHCPNWAKPEVARSLVPVLLAGAWDETKEADRKAIEKIAQKPYEEVSTNLTRWINESDPPVRRVGNIWQLVSREDSWHLLSRFVIRNDLEAFENVALSVLGTLDPRYELLPNQRWAAAVYGKQLPHSVFLRQSLTETLALLATRGGISSIQDAMSGQNRATTIVRKLFGLATGWKLWASLSHLLPTLAEAAPEALLDAVDDALVGNAPVLLGMFADEGTMGSSPHTGLVWALETFAWEPGYLSRTALLLAKLARLDPGGRILNRPQNSLGEIFLCWRHQTPATINQRLKVVDTLLAHEPDVTWKLLCSILPESSSTSKPIHRPRWREWGSNWSPKVTQTQYWHSIDEVVERVLANVGTNGKRWSNVISHVAYLPLKSRDKAIEKLLVLDCTQIQSGDRLEIWKSLRSVIHKHRKFSDADWAMPVEVVNRLYLAYQKFQPDNFIDCYAWLFSRRTELPDSASRDWQIENDAREKARIEAVAEIYSKGGVTALLELAARTELPKHLGFVIGKSEKASDFECEFLSSTLGQSNRALKELSIGFVDSRFNTIGWPWAEEMLASESSTQWSVQQHTDFFCGLPFENHAWKLLSAFGEETETLYWKQVLVYFFSKDDCEEATRKLLVAGRPYAALELVTLCLSNEDKPWSISALLLVDILEQAATVDSNQEEPRIDVNSVNYNVEQIFRSLENSDAVEEARIARLEWIYLPLLVHSERQPRILHKELSRDPLFFAEVIKFVYTSENDEENDSTEPSEAAVIRAKLGNKLLESWYQIPGLTQAGTVDLEQLRTWVIQARAACQSSGRSAIGDQKIGQVLAYAPVAPDGFWPDVAVREVIEELASRGIDTGIEIGIYDKRGIYNKAIGEGGLQERELAESYRKYAIAIGDTWPRTASLLRRIADGYESEARQEDIRAELRDY